MGNATTNNFDIKSFLTKWGKCLDDIGGCNHTLDTGSGPTSAMAKINSVANKANSLSECLSSIQSVLQFLSNKDENVKNHAASTIANLAVKAVEFLQKENDPAVIKKTADFLLNVVDKIQNNGSISLDTTTKQALEQVTQLVNKKLKNSGDKDHFVRYSKEDFADATKDKLGKMSKGFETEKFVDSVNSAKHNLIGNTNYTKFVTSTGKAMKTLIGDI